MANMPLALALQEKIRHQNTDTSGDSSCRTKAFASGLELTCDVTDLTDTLALDRELRISRLLDHGQNQRSE